MSIRGIGTLYAGLLIMTTLAGLAIYVVYIGKMSLHALRLQQALQEHVEYVALHANVSGDSITLPDHSDVIVVDEKDIPHIAVNVKQVSIPWNTGNARIYVVEHGESVQLGRRVFKPIAVAQVKMSSNGLISANLSSDAIINAVLCSFSYQDPFIYSYFNDPMAYRGYVPLWSTADKGKIMFGVRGVCSLFNRHNLEPRNNEWGAINWTEFLAMAGFNSTAIARINTEFCNFFNTTLAKEISIDAGNILWTFNDNWFYQPVHVVIRPPTLAPTLVIVGLAHRDYTWSYAYLIVIHGDGSYEYNYTLVPVSAYSDRWGRGYYRTTGSTTLSLGDITAFFSWEIDVDYNAWFKFAPYDYERIWGTVKIGNLEIRFYASTEGTYELDTRPDTVWFRGTYSFNTTVKALEPVLWYEEANLIMDTSDPYNVEPPEIQQFNESTIGFFDGRNQPYNTYYITAYSNTSRVMSILYVIDAILYTPCNQLNVLP
jgi:hypothetical protein